MSVAPSLLPLLPPPLTTRPEAMNHDTGLPGLIQRTTVALNNFTISCSKPPTCGRPSQPYLIHTGQVASHFHRPFPPLPTPPPRPLPVPSSTSSCDTPPPRPRHSPPFPDRPATPDTPSPLHHLGVTIAPNDKHLHPCTLMQIGMIGTQTPNVVSWNSKPIHTFVRTGHTSPEGWDFQWNSAKLVGTRFKTSMDQQVPTPSPPPAHSPAILHSPTSPANTAPQQLSEPDFSSTRNLLLQLRGRPLLLVKMNSSQIGASVVIHTASRSKPPAQIATCAQTEHIHDINRTVSRGLPRRLRFLRCP